MARLFNDAANDYLQNTNAVVSGVPLTMACWFNTDDLAIDQTIMGLFPSVGGSNYFRLWLDAAANHVNADATDFANGNTQATTTTSYAANSWYHAAGVYAASNDKRAFLNGGGKGTDATDVTPVGIDRTEIGRLGSHGGIQYTSGLIGEVAIWNVALTDDEIAILAEGVCPVFVRPGSLISYWSLIRNLIDIVGKYDMSAIGTTIISHCRICNPNTNSVLIAPAAAGPSPSGIMTLNTGYWGSI
jgi:hypothetical protein